MVKGARGASAYQTRTINKVPVIKVVALVL